MPNPIKGAVAGVKLAKIAAKKQNTPLTPGMVAKGIKAGVTNPKAAVNGVKQIKAVKALAKETNERLKDPKVQAQLKALAPKK
jgi:hypothetical protein